MLKSRNCFLAVAYAAIVVFGTSIGAAADDLTVRRFDSGDAPDKVGIADASEDVELFGPQALTTDAAGNLFLLDQLNQRILRFNPKQPAEEPSSGLDVVYLDGGKAKMNVKHLILAKYDDQNYGYLRIYVDKDYLKIGFHQVGSRSLQQSRFDMVTVRLEDHHMVAN